MTRQILQYLRTGNYLIADLHCSKTEAGQLLIRSAYSVISAGTERMLVEFGKANLLNKARQQPDKVKTDGLLPTIALVRNKLDQPLTLDTATLVSLIRELICPLSHVKTQSPNTLISFNYFEDMRAHGGLLEGNPSISIVRGPAYAQKYFDPALPQQFFCE